MQLITPTLQPLSASIGIVVSQFNQDITQRLQTGAVDTLKQYIDHDSITVCQVPGAVEIPYALQTLARSQRFDALIALGAVIFGETDHYHYVSQQVSQGCQRIMLDEAIPIAFGVLTVKTHEQAMARTGGNKGHLGKESAVAVLKMLQIKALS